MNDRSASVVYLLIAAAAGFVTASRNLPLPLLLLILLALAIVATLVRRQVLEVGGVTRLTVAFLAVYIVTFVAVRVVLGR